MGVKEQDNLTAPPFPLKTPQARSYLRGEGNIDIMFSPYLGGLIIYYYSPFLPNGCVYKGKRQHKADFMLTCNGNNTTSNHDRALVCPFWHGGWEVWGWKDFCKVHLDYANPSLTALSHGSARMEVAPLVLQVFWHCWAKILSLPPAPDPILLLVGTTSIPSCQLQRK